MGACHALCTFHTCKAARPSYNPQDMRARHLHARLSHCSHLLGCTPRPTAFDFHRIHNPLPKAYTGVSYVSCGCFRVSVAPADMSPTSSATLCSPSPVRCIWGCGPGSCVATDLPAHPDKKQAQHIKYMHQRRPVRLQRDPFGWQRTRVVICRSVKSQFFYKPRSINDRNHCWNTKLSNTISSKFT